MGGNPEQNFTHPLANTVNRVFREKPEGEMPFSEAVEAIKDGGIGIPIYRGQQKDLFGVVVPIENIKPYDPNESRTSEILLMFSEGLAVLGSTPERHIFKPIPPESFVKKDANGHKVVNLEAVDTQKTLAWYANIPDASFVQDLLGNISHTERGEEYEEYIDAQRLLESILSRTPKVTIKREGILRRKKEYLEPLPPHEESLEKIVMSIFNKKLLSIRSVYSLDPDVLKHLSLIERISRVHIDDTPEQIAKWVGRRAEFKDFQREKIPHEELAKRWRESLTGNQGPITQAETSIQQDGIQTSEGTKPFPPLSSPITPDEAKNN